jgi:hypothetical protein
MSEMTTGSIKCAVCGKYFSNEETVCPYCGSMRQGANKEPPGLEINAADEVTISESTGATLTHIAINTESGAITQLTTTVPPEVLEQDKEERDSHATSLVFRQNKYLKRFKDGIQKAIQASLDGDEEKSSFQKGQYFIFNQCEIHGEIGTADMGFNVKWNQIKNSINIDKLQEEFERLIYHLPKKATNPEHYKDIAEAVIASEELNKANGPGMLKHLKKASNWLSEAAEEIAARVIVELIMQKF